MDGHKHDKIPVASYLTWMTHRTMGSAAECNQPGLCSKTAVWIKVSGGMDAI